MIYGVKYLVCHGYVVIRKKFTLGQSVKDRTSYVE